MSIYILKVNIQYIEKVKIFMYIYQIDKFERPSHERDTVARKSCFEYIFLKKSLRTARLSVSEKRSVVRAVLIILQL